MPPSKAARVSVFGKVAGFFAGVLEDLFGDASAEPAGQTGASRARARLRSSYAVVSQTDETGCGVACVAMLAGVSYDDAKAVLFASIRRKRVFYTGYGEIKRALRHYGIGFEDAARARRFSTWRVLKSTAVVAVEQSPPVKNKWHWVVFVRDGERRYVLDPAWPEIVRADLRALKGRSFMLLDEKTPSPRASRAPSRRKK